jgi:hypothetical protein
MIHFSFLFYRTRILDARFSILDLLGPQGTPGYLPRPFLKMFSSAMILGPGE